MNSLLIFAHCVFPSSQKSKCWSQKIYLLPNRFKKMLGCPNTDVCHYFDFFLLFFCFFNNMVLKHSFPPIRSHDVILWHSLPINSEYNLWLLTVLWCVSRKEKEEPRVVSYHVFSYIRFTNESFCWTDSLQWFGQNIRLRLASA